MDGSLGSYSNHTLSPWSRYCCNALMQSLSNSTSSSQSSSSSYQQNSDLSYYSQIAQSSNYYPSFFQQRLTLSSTLSPFHSHLTSCYQSATNDVGYRPLSTFPPIPEARAPFWFSSLDSCASLYGNSFYRFFPSPSQASLPPISPSSDHFYPRTASLPSPFALSSAKSSHCCTDLSSPPPVVTSQTESATVDARDNLTVRVKTESHLAATTFSPPVKCTAQCCSPSFQRNSFHDQIKQESFNRDSEGYLIATRFPPVCPPNLEEAQQRNEVQPINYHKSVDETIKNTDNQSRDDFKERPFSAIVTPLQKSEKSKNIFKECRKQETANSAEIDKAELMNVEKQMPITSLANSITVPKLKSQELNNSVIEKCNQNESEVPICLSKSEKEITPTLSASLKKTKHSKPNISSQVPVGIAIARKRHTSPSSKRNSVESKNTMNSLEIKQQIQNTVKEQKPLEPSSVALKRDDEVIESSTPTMTIAPDYRLARDAVTGQFYLISTAASFIQSQLISNSEPNIPPLDVNSSPMTNTELPAVDRDDDKPERKVVEQATQACLSDEENEQLLISSNCVTSSVQVDMDAEDEPLSLCIDNPIKEEEEEEKEEVKRSSPATDWKECDSSSLSPNISATLESDSKSTTNEVKESTKNDSSSVCTDGLNLLSALAEQRSLEERRRHSTDCSQLEKEEAEPMNIDLTKPVKKRQRSESCISAIDLPKNDTSNATLSTQNDGGTKKKRKYSNSSDPWMIRRSERIFLNEALQQSQNSANTHLSNKSDSSHSCKLSLSKKIKTRKKSKDDCKSIPDTETELATIEETSDEIKSDCVKQFSSDDFKLKDNFLNNQRIMIKIEDLLYAGSVSAIQAPDVYGITLDGERSQHKHIYSREDVLKEAIVEIKPENRHQLSDGTRVCAYWSQQYKCLYAGRVAMSANPIPLPDRNLIFVEFDDGDKGRIPLNDVRLLPQDYPPIKSEKSNPQMANKRNKFSDENMEEKESNDSCSAEISEESGDNKSSDSTTESSEKSKKKKKHCKGIKKHHKRHKHRHCKHHKRKRKHKKKEVDTTRKVEAANDINKKNEANKETKNAAIEEKLSFSKRAQRRKERISSSEKSKIAPFLPLQQLWHWSGKSCRKVGNKGKTRKEFYKAIHRGKEVIKVGDSAVFLSTGRPNLPYVGKIDSMWQSGNGNMIVKVKWFYHPEETKAKPDLVDTRGALFESSHYDENDVQTIAHKCEVLVWEEYDERRRKKPDVSIDDPPNVYYLGGSYDPLVGKLQIASKVPLRRSLTV